MKKDLVLAVLATFCFTCTLFMVNTTRSATNPYDPWLDYDENGTIGLTDLVRLAQSYTTLGDSTKNVTIARHANKLAWTVSTTIPADGIYSTPWISVDGYSRVAICLDTSSTNNFYALEAASTSGGHLFYVDNLLDSTTDLVKTYDVPNALISVYFRNDGTNQKTLYIDVYCMP
jgi:hypothetical protein